MIFLTVGTQFAFDRLVGAVDEAVAKGLVYDTIYAQIGETSYVPRNFEYVRFLDKTSFDDHIAGASAVMSHAGMGIISIAFEKYKPLLVMPRRKKYGEVVNDHQVIIAKKYEQLGHLLAAYAETELPDKITQLRTFVPKPRQNQAYMVAERIRRFLSEICPY
jgi:UDP-N-acetylglucosamine transferase subunit ALG13